MSTKERRFIPFHLLLPSHPDFTAECAAHKNDDGRCTSKLKIGAITRIDELHSKLQSNDKTAHDHETREELLRELADLAICGHQKRLGGIMEAAVEQWNSELLPPGNAADIPDITPETPLQNANAQSRDKARSSMLVFTPYKPPKIDEKLNTDKPSHELDLWTDRKIIEKLAKCDWKNEKDYLYIFQCDQAPGMCKVGRTIDDSRRADEHKKCYANIEQRRVISCPNAEVFETVMQAVFRRHRYEHFCGQCNRTHTEWFKLDIDVVFQHIQVWCQFSKHIQNPEKRCQVKISLPGSSQDPDRWYKWAQDLIQSWKERELPSQPNTSDKPFVIVDNAVYAVRDPNAKDDVESVPGLSPPSSAFASPRDDDSDPPTPTPTERSRDGKRMLQPLSTRTASRSVSSKAYFTPVERISTLEYGVLFPRIYGEYPDFPIKPCRKNPGGNEMGLEDIFESFKLV
ncbi:hypothetical protein BDV06DRAFT_234886 [Aspergillus oleicola]